MRLMREGAVAAGCDPSRIHCLYEEAEAAVHALRLAEPGDVVVLTPTRVEAVWETVRAFQPDRRPEPPASTPVLEPAHG